MDITLLKLEGKPVEKLVDTLGEGAGVLYEPRRIREKAKAEKDADLIKAQGEVEVQELMIRSAYRLRADEIRHQKNLDAVAMKAHMALPASVDLKPVDPDWTADFVNAAREVSHEEMQRLWARILAGEVAQPGSFSRRKLAAVRVMSREDADRFTRFRSFVWHINGAGCCIQDPNAERLMEQATVHYGTLMNLRATGLIFDEGIGPVAQSYEFVEGKEYELEYFDTRLTGRLVSGRAKTFVTVAPVTPVGLELLAIAGGTRNEDYFKSCVTHFQANGLELDGLPEAFSSE